MKEYRAVGVAVWLAECNAGVRAMLKRGHFAERSVATKEEYTPGSIAVVFSLMEDAVTAYLQTKKNAQ